MKELTELIQRWRAAGLALHAPAEAAIVRQAFAHVGSRATSDVIALYARIGGMDDMDEEFWRLWSPSQIVEENGAWSPVGVLFSDYMASCWCYRLQPNEDDTSAVFIDHFNGEAPVRIADTLAGFFASYIKDPTALLFGVP